MRKLYVVLLSLLAACAYGVVHDQVTARICLEYFTVAHPPLFPTSSTTLLALCWGVAATAGIGLVFGSVLAAVSQSGSSQPWPITRLVLPVLSLLVVMGAAAFSAGLVGYTLSARGLLHLPTSLAVAVSPRDHDRFMAVWFAHGASYLFGFVGAGVLCLRVWAARGRPSVIAVFPRTRATWLRAFALAAAVGWILWFRFAAR